MIHPRMFERGMPDGVGTFAGVEMLVLDSKSFDSSRKRKNDERFWLNLGK
jgi:hypothetical protein